MSKPKIRPVVLCGPSGCGKSTLIKELKTAHPGCFGFSVSHTTRKPRYGEQNGVHYHFVTTEQMKASIERQEFIEHAEYSGNLYGTSYKTGSVIIKCTFYNFSKESIEQVQIRGQICLLDIDSQGVTNIKKTTLNPICIFIKPPSFETLEQRLRDRGTETEDKILQRLSFANKELEFGDQAGVFDKVIVNDRLKDALHELEGFIKDLIVQAKSCRK